MRALLLSLLCIFLLMGHVSASETQGSRSGLGEWQPLDPPVVAPARAAVDGLEIEQAGLLPTLHWGAKWFLTGICVSLLFVLFLYLMPGSDPHKNVAESGPAGDSGGPQVVGVHRQEGVRPYALDGLASHGIASGVQHPARPTETQHGVASPSLSGGAGGHVPGSQLPVGPGGYAHAQPNFYMPYLPAIPISLAGANSHWPHGQPPPGGGVGAYEMGGAVQPAGGNAVTAGGADVHAEREWNVDQLDGVQDGQITAATSLVQAGPEGNNRQPPDVVLSANPFGVKLGDDESSHPDETIAETREEESIVDEIVRENRELKLFAC
jgi:hypothetical protein